MNQKNYSESDWRSEVANGDTRLGYEEWCEHKREVDEDVKSLVMTETVQRASLVLGVYNMLLDGTESFEGEIGADVAYFMGEVLKGEKFQAWLGVNDEFMRVLLRAFDHMNGVWDSVDLMNDDVDDVFPARIKAAILAGDVANLDEEDYPQAGAWVDVLKAKGE